jgi:hypothetical protein
MIGIDFAGNAGDFFVIKSAGATLTVDAELGENVVRHLRTNAEDVAEREANLLLFRDVDACDTGHSVFPSLRAVIVLCIRLMHEDGDQRRFLALTLLETGVLLVDDEALALADDDLAIHGSALNAAADFHGGSLWLSDWCSRR